MKKNLKCMISVLLSMLLIILAIPNIASAKSISEIELDSINQTVNSSSVKTTETVDELSFIEKIKSYTADELYDLGCTKEEVSYIMNYDYNQDLVNLSKNANSFSIWSFNNNACSVC